MKKFLLIDDHFVVRSGMKSLLIELYPGAEVHEAEDENSVAEKLKEHEYDLVLMDIQIPGSDMLSVMESMHTEYPEIKVLMFSMGAENMYAKRFLKAGAKGFLSKSSSFDVTKKAIDMVLNNRKYISESLAESLYDNSISNAPLNPFDKLSRREFEIISLLLAGRSIKEICKFLNLGASTVGTYKARIFEKLGVRGILELKEMATFYELL